ncbi:hypothetical protein HOY82DRAFT_649247 [Tuber indicum]|nr:hypothetical protein HOY82DRAFT_649247 [Tuber indicum]
MKPSMREIHIKALVTPILLFSCLSPLLSPVFSLPVSSIELPTLLRPGTANKTALCAPIQTDPPEPPLDVPLPSKVEAATSQINGMSIFWIIMPLSMACMTHPIGSAFGLEPAYRHRIRIGPLISLFDTLHLLYEVLDHCRNTGDPISAICRIPNSTQKVVEMRHRTRRDHNDCDPQVGPWAVTLLGRFETCLYNTPIRHLLSVVLILQYVKLCGFHGIPMSFSLGTGYFTSWIIMEMILLIGEGLGGGRATTEPRQRAPPGSAQSETPTILKSVGRAVFLLQSITILTGVYMLLWKTQNDFKLLPRDGETVPSFILRLAAFLTISSSLMYWADSMPLFIGISLMSGLQAPGHKGATGVSNFIGLLMAIMYVTITTTVFYSGWVFGAAHLPFVSYIAFVYASRLLWKGEGWEGCLSMARLEPVLIFGSSAFTYAGGLLFFYFFVFNPEGTWRAAWTESLP